MGYAAYHFNAFQKERLGWLDYGDELEEEVGREPIDGQVSDLVDDQESG
jgi:hypothetical protein